MGNFTKTLVSVVSAIFAVLAIGAFISGNGKESITLLVISAVVALCGGIGLFFQRFPPPPLVPGEGKKGVKSLLDPYNPFLYINCHG